ncbi:MAG: DNA polymerase III subunit beta [Canibacter sp.]
MRFTVNRDVFQEAVSFTVKMLPSRNPQPVLGGVLLEAADGELTLSIFNFEVSARTSITADVETAGRALVPGRLLGEIAQRMPHADVEVSLEEGRVEVRCGSASFRLPAMPVEEYPQVPQIDAVSGEVPADVFSAAVAQVSLAASREDVTPVITSVQFAVSDSSLTLTATDRYRVAIRGIDWENSAPGDDLTALVPAKFVSEVGKMFGTSGTVKIAMSDSSDRELIGFIADGKTVTSQLIKGNYPPVGRLFPDSVEHYAVVNTQELVEAVGRVALVVDRDAALRFSFSEGQVSLEAAGSESAQAQEVVDAHLAGDDIVISLKPQFLTDGLRGANSEFTRISFTHSDAPNKPGPVLITGQRSKDQEDEGSFRYLLQPNLLLR